MLTTVFGQGRIAASGVPKKAKKTPTAGAAAGGVIKKAKKTAAKSKEEKAAKSKEEKAEKAAGGGCKTSE